MQDSFYDNHRNLYTDPVDTQVIAGAQVATGRAIFEAIKPPTEVKSKSGLYMPAPTPTNSTPLVYRLLAAGDDFKKAHKIEDITGEQYACIQHLAGDSFVNSTICVFDTLDVLFWYSDEGLKLQG